jgi:hypothetical protein
MKQYHLILMLISFFYNIQPIFSCPCMPSTNNSQPFFEQYDTTEQEETNNEEEVE